MKPITRDEMYLAAAAGEYSGELPEPVTRLEYYLKKIKEAVENGSSVAPEDIDAAIEAYLNSHDADIVTEQELSDALAGYYGKDAVDTALNEKQNTLTAGDNISINTVNGELIISATDTTYSDATQQTHGLMSTADKTKLDGITAAKMQAWDAAEQNVNADWTAESGDAQILHKPDLSIYALAANVTKSALGIDNVDNTSDANKPISTATQTALAGKAAASHAHDDRYYTETEIDNKLGEKSNTGHTHDDRYYTEDETDTLLSGKADSSDIPDVSSFITKAVNDLTNYYTKSETYTQAEIDNMVSAIPKFAIEVVQALPSQNISPTTVYLLTVQSGQQGNMYDEYIHVGNSWELLGTQTVDLSGYYTSAQVDTLLSGLPVAGHTHDERYYTESEIDGKIQTINTAISGKAASDHTHDDRYYTETEIDNKLGGKSNTGHSHAQSDITGLDSALAGKAAASHTHAQSDITGLSDALSGKADANHNHSGVYAPASHTHTKSQITDLANVSASAAGLMSAADKKKLDKINIVVLTQAQYDAIASPDSNTLYLIPEASA